MKECAYTDNCGVTWINGITHYDYQHMDSKSMGELRQNILHCIAQEKPNYLMLYSDNHGGYKGRELARIITEEFLWGIIYTEGPEAMNSDTGNYIKVFIWKPSKKFWNDWKEYKNYE